MLEGARPDRRAKAQDRSGASVGARRRPEAAAMRHQAGGIAWQKGDVDAGLRRSKGATTSRCSCTGAPSGARRATRSRRRSSTARISSSGRAFSCPVYIDGDSASAQRLGDRFKVSGYPTMILFKPDGGRDHAPAGRGRGRPVHARAGDGHERRAAGQGDACRRAVGQAAARPALIRRRLAHARLLFVGHRRKSPGCRQGAGADPASAGQGLPGGPGGHRDAAAAAGAGRRSDRQGRQAARRQGCGGRSAAACWPIREARARKLRPADLLRRQGRRVCDAAP